MKNEKNLLSAVIAILAIFTVILAVSCEKEVPEEKEEIPPDPRIHSVDYHNSGPFEGELEIALYGLSTWDKEVWEIYSIVFYIQHPIDKNTKRQVTNPRITSSGGSVIDYGFKLSDWTLGNNEWLNSRTIGAQYLYTNGKKSNIVWKTVGQ